jgi:hydroxymethylpyrimidine/phosphomethylpyrimidine kinase
MIPVALTVAGSDSSGGAGIQADLKTFSSLGVYGLTVVTAVTAQDSSRVHDVFVLPATCVAAQIDAAVADLRPRVVKVGMLGNRANIEAVWERVRALELTRVVLDPVMASTAGTPLLEPDAVDVLRRVLPETLLITPNMAEAALLSRRVVRTVADMAEAARALHGMGAPNALVTGGHLSGSEVVDVFYDGEHILEMGRPRIPSDVHGTGCVLSAAVAAHLARDLPMDDSIVQAAEFAAESIRTSLVTSRGRVCNPVRD